MTRKPVDKSQLLLGKLPTDFLRLEMPETSTSAYPLQHAPAQPTCFTPHYVQATGQVVQSNKLSITVAEAKLTKNYGITKMDPYARMRIGHMIFETPTCSNGSKHPQWNKNMTCYLPDGVDTIYFEILDERAFTVDSKIAWQHFKIPEAVLQGELVDDWYPLNGEQGDNKEGLLHLVISLKKVTDTVHRPMILNTGLPIAPQGSTASNLVPPKPLYTEDDKKNLKEMFPSFEVDVIVSILEQNGGNMDQTVKHLLAMSE